MTKFDLLVLALVAFCFVPACSVEKPVEPVVIQAECDCALDPPACPCPPAVVVPDPGPVAAPPPPPVPAEPVAAPVCADGNCGQQSERPRRGLLRGFFRRR